VRFTPATFALGLILAVFSVDAHAKKSTKKKNQLDHYKVKSGEFLGTISTRLYGTAKYASDIYHWNQSQIKNRNQLTVGQTLILRRRRTLTDEQGKQAVYELYTKRNMPFIASVPPPAPVVQAVLSPPPPPPPAPPPQPMVKAANTDVLRKMEADKKAQMANNPALKMTSDGETLMKQGKLAEAQAQFSEASSEDPNDPAPRILEISTLLRMGKTDEAKERAQDLVKKDPEYCSLTVIKKLTTDEECPGASDAQATAAPLPPPPPPVAATEAAPVAAGPVVIKAANTDTIKKIETEKKVQAASSPALKMTQDGESMLKQGKLSEAQAQFAEATNEDPNDPAPRVFEISTLLRMGKNEEAKLRAKDLVQKDPDFCSLAVVKKLTDDGDCTP